LAIVVLCQRAAARYSPAALSRSINADRRADDSMQESCERGVR
jgi:hypothetical protein